MLLLRLRDGKTRGIKRGGVLEQLTNELIAAAKEEGGYPDSDDEEEENERPRSTKSNRMARKQTHQDIDNSLVSQDLDTSPYASYPAMMQQRQRSPGTTANAITALPGKRMRMGVFTK